MNEQTTSSRPIAAEPEPEASELVTVDNQRSPRSWSPSEWLGVMHDLLGGDLHCLYVSTVEDASGARPSGGAIQWIDLGRREEREDGAEESTISTEHAQLEEVAYDLVAWNGSAPVIAMVEERLRETTRYLKPDGVLLIAALLNGRDLDGREGEGFYVPPSFWQAQLRPLGFECALRMNRRQGVLEWLCGRPSAENWEALRDAFLEEGAQADMDIQIEGEELYITPASNAMTDTEGDAGEEEAIYLLNPHGKPLAIRVEFRSQGESHPDLYLDELKLRYLAGDEEGGEWRHCWSAAIIPPGGRRLRLAWRGASRSSARLQLQAQTIDAEAFLQTLPFDHYQRYRLAADLLDALIPAGSPILDVGGALGYLPLFARNHRITTIDLAWEDSPRSRMYGGGRLPWSDHRFQAVVCVDALEHVPNGQRADFLGELRRVSSSAVILSCPFDEPNVAEAEGVLREFLLHRLGKRDRFLDEHRDYSLPNLGEVSELFEQDHWSVTGLPSGYLPRWLAMQFVQFIFAEAPELWESRAQLNALYNGTYYASDNRFPSYRIALVATRDPLAEPHRQALSRLISSDGDLSTGEMWGVASLTASLAQFNLLREKEASLQRNSQQVDRLLDHIRNLEGMLEEARRHADNVNHSLAEREKLHKDLSAHISNLDEQECQRAAHLKNLDDHIRNLENLIQERDRHAANLQAMLDEQIKRSQALEAEIAAYNKREAKIDTFMAEAQSLFSDVAREAVTPEQLMSDLAQLRREVDEVCAKLNLLPEANLPRSVKLAAEALQSILREKSHLMDELERVRGAFLVRLLRKIGLVPKPRGMEPE